jgi:two-component sensor histidine kinase
LLNIGINPFNTLNLQALKIRRLYNGLTASGIVISILHFINFFTIDKIAAILHLSWGIVCCFCLWIHAKGNYQLAKIITSYTVLTCGYLASARIGWEVYPHFPAFGILVAAFIFFSDKKEFVHWLVILILSILGAFLVESNYLKSDHPGFSHEAIMRFVNLSGTIIFVAYEILFLVRLGQLNESKINKKLQQSNIQLKESNEQKNILIQEIHHRVKNNLQVIISLLKLHSHDISDEKALEIIANFKRRLISISIMHEMMYTSNKTGEVDFKSFINRLSENMLISAKQDVPVKIFVDTNVSKIKNASIVPLALIIHELLSNSFKHAFKQIEEIGKIEVALQKVGKDYLLTYSDNGSWSANTHPNFGTELLELLVQQLSGKINITPSPDSTRYEIVLEL